jgi:phenylalanyl-tRNA synthetase beta chain
MKFIYQDLLNFLTHQPSKEDLSKKLFQLGHEHEIIGDIFDMEITPNRGDCLSLIGLSRDLNNFYDSKDPFEIYDEEIESLDINFTNLSTESCPKISFLEIEIDKDISPYKPYLKNYFLLPGNKKTNFFTDISNYVSYERGQPTHCFDRETINESLTFCEKSCDEDFKTLLGEKIRLRDNNCIFMVDDEIISLAGVMGGESTACSKETKKVLVECAYFDPEAIIGKTIKYNLKSDAAHKFERGVDFASQEKALRRYISIVKDHVSIKSLKMKTFIGKDFEDKYLPIDIVKINKVLGTDLKYDDYIIYLNKLGFEIEDMIKVPSFRHDIINQNDLSEEIARIIGFDKIKNIPLNLNTNFSSKQNQISYIEDFFVQNGFSEVINFPFTAIEEDKSIFIDNPLDSNRKNLRTSLKESLIENLLFNERRQKDSLKLFEISDIYSNEENITQEKRLGIIVSGRHGHNYEEFAKKLDSKYLNKILNLDHNMQIFDIEEVSRETLKTKKREKIFYSEISLEDIPNTMFKDFKHKRNKIDFIKYNPISEFPSSTRDFSFSIKNLKQYDNVISIIDDFNNQNLKDSFVFDFYINKKLGEIKVGVRFIFQSHTKTLSDEDIKRSVDDVLKPFLNLDGVFIPGLELK